MTNTYNIQKNDQLFVNNKWYFDVMDVEGDSVKVRIKYYEAPTKNFYHYRTIKLPKTFFQNCVQDNFIVRCQIHEPQLKLQIGGLINRLAIETDVLSLAERINHIKEDVAAAGDGGGMGAVVNPGMSGTPGEIGSMGSGDISTQIRYGSTKLGITPNREFGLQIQSKSNMKHIRKSAKKQKGVLIKKPIMTIGESNDPQIEVTNSDHDYKTSIYTFLDYPTDNENDLQLIGCVAEYRPDMLEISAERLVQYFRDLYKTNKALIKDKCSEWFQNQILVLAQLSE
jgi:hypothetical protein